MSNPEQPSNGRLTWLPFIFSILLVIVSAAVQYGITSTTLSEHTRRIELLEKRMEERSVARDEYERRHEDLQRLVREQEQRIRELERKVR